MSTQPIRLGLVGIGKIARDQHLPALHGNAAFALVAAASRHSTLEQIPTFTDIESMLRAATELQAVSLCTPPAGRYAQARAALDAGLHVMLEKPPGATVSEVLDLERQARVDGLTLFASWHSRAAGGVEPARTWLAQRAVRSIRVAWKEDIRVWHPGQNWILEPAGLGVFDPGINALSILTRILPRHLALQDAVLHFPANRHAPIAARLELLHGDGTAIAELDFLHAGAPHWNIEIETDRGLLQLSEGGRRLRIGDSEPLHFPDFEYPRLYGHFAELIAARASDVDLTPLQLVADAFLIGRRHEAAAFEF